MMIRESERHGISGVMVLIALLLAIAATAVLFIAGAVRLPRPAGVQMVLAVLLFVFEIFLLRGLFVVAPNQAQVLQLFGDYVGTAKRPGLRWINPFISRRRISLRVRNFESSRSKVNDAEGNPIEIAAVLVWRVVETAEATFEVDDYENYVKVQTEAALRNAATSYPYDSYEDGVVSLRGSTATVADHLKQEVQRRLDKAGVEVIEARISHLAYAPEIAAAMLQRQQAGAIIAARERIVQGAVGMVEMALQMLAHKDIVHLDEERKAAMVSNLLVVLCGERSPQPIVNTGTIHQ
jgi:regulator of protease activity HflC (stomatin/prohibitin superfamily)